MRSTRRGKRPSGHRATSPLLFVFLFACLSVALLNSFWIDKHLSADGVHYFRAVLDSGDFLRVDPARWFAETLIQGPLVLAVRAGVTEVPTLSAVFAVGIYLPYALSFALCLFAVRRENASLLALPILSMASANLPADYILAGEHHVMLLLASPILLLVLRRTAPTAWDGFLLLLALLVFTRSYQTAVVPALLFAVLLAARLASDRRNRSASVVRGLALALSIATIVVGVPSIANPHDPTNRDFFRHSLKAIVTFPEALVPAAFSMLYLLGLGSRRRVVLAFPAVALVLYVPFVLGTDHGLSALASFSTRTLSVTLLPVLLLLAVVAHARGPSLGGPAQALLVAMVLAIVSWNIRHSADWSRYRDDMTKVLGNERGFVPLERTDLDHNPCRWGWTSPGLSVVWSWPVVRAIVVNRVNEPWEPFDPRRTLILKRYVLYDPVFAGVDPTARFARQPQ